MTQPVLPTPDAAARLCICGRTIVGALSSCCFWHALVSLGRFTLAQVDEVMAS